jgi:hypothetical protein
MDEFKEYVESMASKDLIILHHMLQKALIHGGEFINSYPETSRMFFDVADAELSERRGR